VLPRAAVRYSKSLVALGVVVAVLFGGAGACSDAENSRPKGDAAQSSDVPVGRPNIVVVLVDDLRWDELGAAGHPYLETPNIDRLAAEGAMFLNAFHAVPLCSPNRASLLTGQYPSRHGIIDNVARDRASHQLQTFPHTLQAAGYETAFVGKWHMGNDPTPRPGFDYWAALPGQGRTVDPLLFENGALGEVEGYVTDVLNERAVRFIQQQREGPFLLYLSHKGVHPDARQLDDGSVDLDYPMVYVPAPRHIGRYDDRVYRRRPNVPDSLAEIGSPASRAALALRAGPEIRDVFGDDFLDPLTGETTIRRRAEMLLAIDEGVGHILNALESARILDRTAVVFTSDNGYFFGEHGFSIERRMPYEEAIRSPLLMRYPPLVAPGLRIGELVSSVDVAPTLLELGGTQVGDHVQGRSFLPLLTGEGPGSRASVLVEFYTYENPMPWLTSMDYRAIRTQRYKYIHWTRHEDELYDLESDPYEMHNLIREPSMDSVTARLRGQLGALSLEALGLGGA
jgi:N-acetylglucosamine-6-sulfatase